VVARRLRGIAIPCALRLLKERAQFTRRPHHDRRTLIVTLQRRYCNGVALGQTVREGVCMAIVTLYCLTQLPEGRPQWFGIKRYALGPKEAFA
jgi:hypothetical protein